MMTARYMLFITKNKKKLQCFIMQSSYEKWVPTGKIIKLDLNNKNIGKIMAYIINRIKEISSP